MQDEKSMLRFKFENIWITQNLAVPDPNDSQNTNSC